MQRAIDNHRCAAVTQECFQLPPRAVSSACVEIQRPRDRICLDLNLEAHARHGVVRRHRTCLRIRVLSGWRTVTERKDRKIESESIWRICPKPIITDKVRCGNEW